MDFENYNRIYFIGIGGIGMSALARYFLLHNRQVAGYDKTPSGITANLTNEGAEIHYSDDITLVPDYFKNSSETLVVYTPAIPSNHSELNYFITNNFRVVKRAQALGVIASVKQTIAVAGTHGKTTTTTLLTHLLANSSVGCDAFLGGISRNFNSNLVLSNKGNNLLVVEADEYDRSFLSLNPTLAIITSVDADHLDIYGSHEHVIESFVQFSSQIKPEGTLLVKEGIKFTPKLANKTKLITYGWSNKANFYPTEIKISNGYYIFTLVTPTSKIPNLRLGIPGRYNLENAIAASAAALQLEISENELRQGLATFKGVARRFDIRYNNGTTIYLDDYAHHPKEIEATINSARELFPDKNITGIFQPHLYSRTRDFADEFASALDKLDKVILLDIYPARELPIEGISSKTIADKMKNTNVLLLSKEALLDWIKTAKLEVLITMGAGDIDRLVSSIEKTLNAQPSA
ncbi:MAG TPA: UDP-N-acetylmuramate--L-alanine ligase [Tenuifilaceae bacterium]|nr:UDP-N-acetylmuramate--L-alanine ligase [Tenuifilaceae bacterium]